MGRFSLTLLAALVTGFLLGAAPKAETLLFKDDFARTELGKPWRLRIGSFAVREGHLVGAEKPEDGHGAVIQAPIAFADAIEAF